MPNALLPDMTAAEIAEMKTIRWFHRIQLDAKTETPGACPHSEVDATSRFGIPEDLTGKTVLDIGAWDGLFSFLAERRGARVTAIDTTFENGGNWGGTVGFNFARRHLGSSVHFEQCSVHELDAARFGQFDYVFFFGVLYHLINPIDALQRVASVTRECCLVESAFMPHPDGLRRGLWEFLPGHDNDPTNYWYPTVGGLVAGLEFAGFKSADVLYAENGRTTVRATWTAPA